MPFSNIARYNAGVRDGMQAASAMLGVTSDEIRLACGEITPEEMHIVKAVLEWRRAAILRKGDGL